MRWAFHPEAAEEYIEACRYYTEIEARLGAAFVYSVETAVEQIVLYPAAWQQVEEDVRRYSLKRFPYGIHYTVEEDFILILSVAHRKRKPGHWHNRLT